MGICGNNILKVMLSHGGEITTQEVADATGYGLGSVASGLFHLKNRGLVKFRMERIPGKNKVPPIRRKYWTLIKKRIDKIERLSKDV